MSSGKKLVATKKLIDQTKLYSVEEAVVLAKQISYAKFDATLDINIKTTADPKYNDQMIRGTVVLPHGTGKAVRIAAFVSDDLIEEARKAWADIVWNVDLLKDLESGKIDFDVLITTPTMIRDLAKVAKALGPKGLMPSPKAGTVTTDVTHTISEIKKGRVEFKLDKGGNIHLPGGKVSFDEQQLSENITAVIKAISDSKPAAIKAKLFKKIAISPTMWPSISLQY